MKRSFLVIFLGLHLLSTALMACDTNLISLISGATSADNFVEKSSKLVALAVKLGKKTGAIETAKPVIDEIMSAWIAFDNNFTQFPPQWAKNDSAWKSKMKMLADMIGQIKFAMNKNELSKAHDMVLEFSKKLTILFEFMPKSKLGQILYRISMSFIGLNENLKRRDVQGFEKHLEAAVDALSQIDGLLSEDNRKVAEPMGSYLEELRKQFYESKKSLGFKTKMTLMTAEDAYVKMNEQLTKIETVQEKR